MGSVCSYPNAEGQEMTKPKFRYINTYGDEDALVWLKYKVNIDGNYDLYAVEIDPDDEIGEIPEWFDDSVNEVGWTDMLNVAGFVGVEYRGCRFYEPHAKSALAHGVAPGQPFMVKTTKPRWYRCGGWEYPDECDVEYETTVIAKAGWTSARIAKTWESFYAKRLKRWNKMADQEAIVKERRINDTKRMFLRTNPFWGNGYYDEMGPDHVRLTLCSSHISYGKIDDRFGWSLLSVEGPWSEQSKLVDKLAEKAVQTYPHLTADFIKGLRTIYGY